jgi:hypothetical protein
VSEFYSKVQGDAYETFQVEQDLLATQLADRQRQMAAYHAGMKGDNRQDILDAQAEYADLKA